MMVAFAVLDVALHIAAALATFFWIRQRLQDHSHQMEKLADEVPVFEPDPRVDELMRVVSSLKGAEALRQVYGKSN